MPPKKKQKIMDSTENTETKIINRQGSYSSETSTAQTAVTSQSSTSTTGDRGNSSTRQATASTMDTLTSESTVQEAGGQTVSQSTSLNIKESQTSKSLPLINVYMLTANVGGNEQALLEMLPAIEGLRQERETQLKELVPGTELMLKIGRLLQDANTTTSANMESETVVIDTNSYTRQWKEDNLPEDSSRWMVRNGEATLIYNNRNHILNEACRRGSLELVKELLASGADINNRSVSGLTPMMIAAWTGNKQLFDLLVELKSDLSLKLENGNNILHVACFGRNRDIIDFVISKKIADIESRGRHGRTAVLKTAVLGDKGMFDFLVSKGSNLSVVDGNGSNILHLACYSDNVEIPLYLVSRDTADINSRGEFGRTPVMFAADKGRKKTFDLLVSRGADLYSVDYGGNTLLHVACFNDNVEILKFLIANQIAEIDCKGEFGRTPVMDAAIFGEKNVFDFLVSKGCDLSLKDEDGNNILHLACLNHKDNVEIVQYLLSLDMFDIDSEGEDRRTAAMYAATEGRKNVFNLLVKKGCDLTLVDDYGDTALYLACFTNCIEIAECIMNENVGGLDRICQNGRTPVMFAAENGCGKMLRLLVNKGSDLSVEDNFGNTILHVACYTDNVDIMQYLMSHNVSGLHRRNRYGKTPLMVAAQKGQKKVFDFLVIKGCDLSLLDNEGNSILHCAAMGGNMSIIENILSTGMVDINRRNHTGRLASEKAQLFNHKKVVDLLQARELAEN